MVSASTVELTWEIKEQEILNILIYADIFQYPLTRKEIFERGKLDTSELDICLLNLVKEERIFLIENYYCLRNEIALIEKRKNRNTRARRYIKIARLVTRIIINFPYIRGVFLSGSISKDCIDKNSDIDFFIVTEPNRLWIAHLFCCIFRRYFLLNRSKFFCFNYLIDSGHLAINEHSLYTAIEIKTLVPLYGYNYYEAILKENTWTNSYFPQYPPLPKEDVSLKKTSLQKLFEWCFDNSLGERFDEWLMNYSIKKRKRKFATKLFEQANYYIDLQRHVAKSHITDRYPKIMDEYWYEVRQRTYLVDKV